MRPKEIRALSLCGTLLFVAASSSTIPKIEPVDLCSFAQSYSQRLLAPMGKRPSAALLEAWGDTDVLSCFLQVEPTFATKRIVGQNDMTIRSLVSGLDEFTFRLSNAYSITSLTLDGRPITYTRLDSQTVTANFDQTVDANQVFHLVIGYDGIAPQDLGFGSIVFGTRSSGASYVYTLSEPFYAYTWWPVKDDQMDKAVMSIWVTVPTGNAAAANGVLQGIDNLAGNRFRYRYQSISPMSAYLLCFAVTNFNSWTLTYNYNGGTMPVDFFIHPESDTPSNRNAWGACVQMLATLSTKYGSYPFLNEKYGIYQFGFGGGMEHQTMTGQGTFSESVTAHELGHQWWGDLVTCETWHDIWLNEGFATYSEAIWLENKPGSTGLAALSAAMQSRKPSAVNGTVYCNDISSVNSIFSSNFSYRKAGWVLHQLRHIVGDTTFFEILSQYRKEYAFSTATTEDFINVAEQVAGRTLRWFFDPWIYQQGALAYLYGYSNTNVNGKNYLLVHIRQTQSGTYPTYSMPVDFRYTASGQTGTSVLWNDARTQYYVVPVSGVTTSQSLDPDGWLLTTSKATESYQPGPPKIVEVSPGTGQGVELKSGFIRIVFHTPVTCRASDFQVRSSDGNLIPFTFSYDNTKNRVTLHLASSGFTLGVRVTVKDSIKAVNSGQALDGELGSTQALPSGNGVAGGTAELTIGF